MKVFIELNYEGYSDIIKAQQITPILEVEKVHQGYRIISPHNYTWNIISDANIRQEWFEDD